ncbi:MAG TPA: phosphatase PAP2 family protein [Anaeromyxobacter sp.]
MVRLLGVALLLVLSPLASGDERCALVETPGGPAALVGPYPRPGSPEDAADQAVVLWEQRTRTPEEVARAASEEVLSLQDFAGALGRAFDPSRHPLTEALLARGAAAAGSCVAAAKKAYARPRPYAADPRVVPSVERESTGSYPSGHATRGALFASLLAELAPERREALLRRGAQIGEDRVIAGVHYPSDVAAGRRLGEALAKALLGDPVFHRALEEARAGEWRSTERGLPADDGEPVPEPR